MNHFRELPKTRRGMWGMGLGIISLFSGPILGIFAAVIRPLIEKTTDSEYVGIASGIGVVAVMLLLPPLALFLNLTAYRRGERSWGIIAGVILGALALLFWLTMILGEFLIPH